MLSVVETTKVFFVCALLVVYCVGHSSHILSECPESRQGSGNQGNMDQSSPVSPPDIATPRWDASSTGGGTKHL